MAGRLEALSLLFAQISLHLKLPDRSAPTVSNVFANVLNVLAIVLKSLKDMDDQEDTEVANGGMSYSSSFIPSNALKPCLKP